MIYELDPTLTGPDELRADPALTLAAQHAYESSQSGPYAMLPCALSYAPLQHVLPKQTLDSIRSHVPAPHSARANILARQFSGPDRGQVEYLFDIGNWSPDFRAEKGKVYGTMLMMLQLPLSKGSIHVASSDVRDKPIIDPRYFGGQGGDVDFEVMVAAQGFADKICRTAPLSGIIRRRAFPVEGEEDFAPWVRSTTITDWHPVGTCAMGGHGGIETGVVDDRLRVYGVKGLRVADASIMPLHICSHPQATVYAIGEKAAAMILEDREK